MFAFLFDKLSFVSKLAPLDKNISMQIIIEETPGRAAKRLKGKIRTEKPGKMEFFCENVNSLATPGRIHLNFPRRTKGMVETHNKS